MCVLACYLQLEKETRELKKQRDLAHSRIDDLLRAIESDKRSLKVNGIQSVNGTSDLRHSQNSLAGYSSDDASDPSQVTEEPLLVTGEDSDEVCSNIRCIEVDESAKDGTCTSSRQSLSESEEIMPLSSEPANSHIMESELSPALSTQLSGTSNTYSYGALEHNIQGVKNTIDSLFKPHSDESSPGTSTSMTASGGLQLTRSRSCRANLITVSPDMGMDEQNESTPPTVLENGRLESVFQRKQWKLPPVIYGANSARLTRDDSQSSEYSCFIDDTKNDNANDGDEDLPTLGSFVAGLREMAKLQYENQTANQVTLILISF